MNLKKALLSLFGCLMLSAGLYAQEIPDEVVNPGPSFSSVDNTHSPQGTTHQRYYQPDFSHNSITSYYGVMLPGSYNSAMKTISFFETSTDDLLLYPNPVYSLARIRLHEPAPLTAFVFIVDMNGVIVSAWQYPAGSQFLDVNMGSLRSGMYSVRVFGPYISFHNLKVIKS